MTKSRREKEEKRCCLRRNSRRWKNANFNAHLWIVHSVPVMSCSVPCYRLPISLVSTTAAAVAKVKVINNYSFSQSTISFSFFSFAGFPYLFAFRQYGERDDDGKDEAKPHSRWVWENLICRKRVFGNHLAEGITAHFSWSRRKRRRGWRGMGRLNWQESHLLCWGWRKLLITSILSISSLDSMAISHL